MCRDVASRMTVAAYNRSALFERRRRLMEDTSTIVLSALGQIVQADQDVDLASTKGCRKGPDAITQARLVSGLPLTMTRALGVLA
jgi:hypothetical protein